MCDGIASIRTDIVFLKGEKLTIQWWGKLTELPEDAEGGAEDEEAEYECTDWINQVPFRLKV